MQLVALSSPTCPASPLYSNKYSENPYIYSLSEMTKNPPPVGGHYIYMRTEFERGCHSRARTPAPFAWIAGCERVPCIQGRQPPALFTDYPHRNINSGHRPTVSTSILENTSGVEGGIGENFGGFGFKWFEGEGEWSDHTLFCTLLVRY